MNQHIVFDRYTQPAKLALFHARVAVSEHGGAAIVDAHLLVGLLKAEPELASFFGPTLAVQRLSECLIGAVATSSLVPTSAEVPFDPAVSLVLRKAILLADNFAHRDVTPAHLLLALLQERPQRAVECLRNVGVDVDNTEVVIGKHLGRGDDVQRASAV